MSTGYFHDESNTNANFKDLFGDGRLWFNTGDIVEYERKTERLTVLDRAKNFVKLSNAVFVSPEYLENVFIQSDLVESLWIHAQADDDFVVAVVIPRKEKEAVVSEADVLASFRVIAAEKGLQSHEVPRAIHLERSANWTAETGELTVSLKLNRAGLRSRYQSVLLSLRGAEQTQESTAVATEAVSSTSSFSGVNLKRSVLEELIESVLPSFVPTKRLSEQGITSTTILTLSELCKGKLFIFFFFF